jgi:tetratricopeptide (TPR) repeat protein
MSIFGPMLPYSAIAGAAIADSQIKQPEQYVKTMRHVAELDPSFYYNLGDYEWNNGQTNEAVKEYEEAAQKDSNALGAARYAYRLITYYLAIGDKIKARTTADFAGEVYSYDGLVAKAGYFELIGDLPQAYEWYNKISERYNDDTEALLFCSRHAESTGDPALDAKIAAQFKHWVANHEKAKLADFKNPPTDGVTLIEDGPTINDAGVVKGDIVTAVRGLRVHNGNQLQIARDADLNPELLLIIWHNNSYREVTVHLPASHRLGVNTENYILKN